MILRILGAGAMLALACGSSLPAEAGVVMSTTRVIFAGQQTERSVQFVNNDEHANVVQVWIDRTEEGSNPTTAVAPFIANPQVFRIAPRAGQAVRLMHTGEAMPQDRESLYYLSFSQLPALAQSDGAKNKLVLMVSSRLKLFYRPAGLPALPSDMIAALQISREPGGIAVHNPTAYHVVVRSAVLHGNGQQDVLATATMLAPFERVQWASKRSGDALRLVLVNDYGADVTGVVNLP